MQIARDDLHCNAVRLIGRDVDRLVHVAERALALGLEVWLSPALWGRPPDQTLRYCVSAAERAEGLRQQHPDRFVLSWAASSLYMQGIVPGKDFAERTREAFTRSRRRTQRQRRLDEFLAAQHSGSRRHHGGLHCLAGLGGRRPGIAST